MRSVPIAFAALLVPAVALSQGTVTMSDDEIVKAASTAAPPSIANQATIMVMQYDGILRVVRDGTNGWTCLPGHDYRKIEPLCADKNAVEWIAAWIRKERPAQNKIGVIYMLAGDEGASALDPYATEPTPDNHWVKTGPHLMIVGPGARTLEGYPREADPDPTKPFVMWPNTQYEHVMLPTK